MKKLIFAGTIILIADAFVFGFVFSNPIDLNPEVYFLNVGQGDSEFVKIGNVGFLIDAGRDNQISANLEKIIPFFNKKIDVVFISHAERDHAGGIFDLINNYDIRSFIFNGENIEIWPEIKSILDEKNIPYFSFKSGDLVKFGDNKILAIWPTEEFLSQKHDDNDSSLVLRFEGNDFSSLFTGDISSKAENLISGLGINSDILKVSHHGSKYSSSERFLNAVSPKISVIEVGKNSYGHPTREAMDRIISAGSKIFRTDLNGVIKIDFEGEKLMVYNL